MMSIQEVARELRVSEKTVRRMLWRGEMKGIRVGGQWRFPVESLATSFPRAWPPPPAFRPRPAARRSES
jgi:excisionase family DNA binding protein